MPRSDWPTLSSPLDPATHALVRAAAVVAGGTEPAIRDALAIAARATPPVWIEELLLQTSLFAGFPRALNATREWRRLVPTPVGPDDTTGDDGHYRHVSTWEVRGEATCAAVYGDSYDRLRHNIAQLHPALDHWMIVEGYGKVLSRPGLDLARRELCIVAACVATGQDRQLHSHLHGALNVGAPADAVHATLTAVRDLVDDDMHRGAMLLWARVREKHERSAS